MKLTAELLRSRVFYDPETGIFTWKPHPGKANGHRAWDKQWAGKPVLQRFVKDPWNPKRISITLKILGKSYGEGRLAWLYVHGHWPQEVDHRDRNPQNNRLDNLREATHSQNQMNKGPMRNNLLGIKGVCFHPKRKARKQYRAQIKIQGEKKIKHIGWFATAEEASVAYQEVARKLHGEFFHNN